jgi:hypothetical protein
MRWSAVFDGQVQRATAGASTVTGLTHLAGQVVGILADGVDVGDGTVSAGGVLTLPRAAQAVSVGLRFRPHARMLVPEFGTGMGAGLGRKQMAGQTRVLFQSTIGCDVNGTALAFRRLGEDVIGVPVPPYTGWKEVSSIGWAVDSAEMVLSQPQAYPWTVLAVVRRITANPG